MIQTPGLTVTDVRPGVWWGFLIEKIQRVGLTVRMLSKRHLACYPSHASVGGDIAGVRDVGAYRNVDMGLANPLCCLVARRILN